MAKIKLSNSTYWDSTGIVHNNESLSTKVINSSGSNSNGSWIKWEDGTMICYNRQTITSSISSSYGSLYKSDGITLSNFPAEFIGIPSVSLYCDGYSSAFVLNWQPSTKSNVGEIILVRINGTVSNAEFNIGYIAIGKWK